MENPRNICQTCLSTDRRLVSTVRMVKILQEIHYEEINNRNICWECESVILKFYRFRKQVKNAQRNLSKKLYQKTLSKLLPIVKPDYDFEFTHNSDPLNSLTVTDNTKPKAIRGIKWHDIENKANNTPDHIRQAKHPLVDSVEPAFAIQNCMEQKSYHHTTMGHKEQSFPTVDHKKPIYPMVDSKEPVDCMELEKYIKMDDQNYPMINCIEPTNHIEVDSKEDTNYPAVDRKEHTIYPPVDHKNFPMVDCVEQKNYPTVEHTNQSFPMEKHKEPTKNYLEQTEECSRLNSIEQMEQSAFDSSNSDSERKLIFADSLKDCKEEQPKQKRSLKQQKKLKEDDLRVMKKYETVLLTEEDMLRRREEKRSHPNYKKIPFKCDTCVLGFTTKDNFDLHNAKKHNVNIGPHRCNVCSTRFTTHSSLTRHRRAHYYYYACTICLYKTSAAKAAVNHCRDKHPHDERGRIHCKQCAAVFRTPEQLEDHTRTEHILYCNDCGEKFKGLRTLRTHQVRIHGVRREFVCDVCTRSFLTKSRLESHLAKHSQTLARRLAYCTLCGIQYRDIHVYRNHLRNSVNHSQDRYQCSECDKKFASKVYRTKHYNFFHLKKSQYNCEDCNKLFISEWRLKNHRQKHHGLSRSRTHGCDQCGKKFYTLSTLRGHQLTHSERRQYMCENCGDTFKQRPALYTHTRLVHQGGRGRGREGGHK